MPANYDNSAWFYDRLSRLVYGDALVNAQVWLLPYIPAGANILVVGGGTGRILEELAKIHPGGLHITYAEVSAKMIALAKKRNIGQNRVTFINDAIENIDQPVNFDVVITAFLFDNFTEPTLGKIFNHIHSLLKPGGLWLYTDFQHTGKWWQWLLLRSMLLFFRILCGVEASKLPDVQKHFDQNNCRLIAQKTFFNEFIISKALSS
ncbi:class I SAM-dependent methyltransferase [soil metagenome]|jgi:ubiquinone/menaquinone biosynthesis C-methylase UbiE